MSTAIKLKHSIKDQVWRSLDQYADIFDAASLIPGVGALLATAGKTMATEAKRQTERQTNDLQESKNKIIEKMIKENLKIIVSIDDIDRLSEEEIIAVFQLVKALADFPNTVYLLAFDYDVVVHALGKVQHGDGKEYLEKVIQIPFEIPAPKMINIHHTLFSKLETILGDISEDKWDKTTWAELFQYGLKNYIKSIRDVIRYTNVFSLKYELLKEETNSIDLLGVTCLQVFEPTVYSKLPNYKSILCGVNEGYSYENWESIKEKIEKAIASLILDDGITTNAEAAKNILYILFPKTRTNNMVIGMGRNYIHRNFLINNNISVSACFDRYFSLMLEDDAIPTDTMKQLIYDMNESDLDEEIKQIYKAGKIIRLLEEIEAYANKGNTVAIPTERAVLIIKSLARQWNSFRVEENGLFSIPFAWRFLFCIDPLLKFMDISSRYPCIRSVFENTDVQPATLALLLDNFETQHGRFTEKDSSSKDGAQLISLDEVLELEKIFIKRSIEALDSGEALREYGGLNFLWMLERLDAQLVTNKKKSLITDDIFLMNFISYCTSHGEIATRITTKIWRVDLKEIEEFVDINEAYRRVSDFVISKEFLLLSNDIQMDAMAFLITMDIQNMKNMSESSLPDISEERIHGELRKLFNSSLSDN